MAQEVQYDNNGNIVKKKFQIKIAGFTLGKGFFIFVGIIVMIIVGSTIYDNNKDKERIAAEKARLEAAMANQPSGVNTDYDFDFHAEMQKTLSEQFGQAPEGFEWDYTGNLVAIGNDSEATAEDVAYMFLRALSILDFSTANRYSEDSNVISSYESYYEDYGIIDYYSNFLRKQFKKSLMSLEVNNVADTAVFADGSKYITFSINVLDLTDKDFWRKDEDELWKTLRVYRETEEDSTKLNQYVYDYIYSKYEDGTIGKRAVTIELVVGKSNGSGWLVTGDSELNAMLQYENGVDVAAYILDAFNTWYQETTLQEQLDAIRNQIDDVKGDSSSDSLSSSDSTVGVNSDVEPTEVPVTEDINVSDSTESSASEGGTN